MKPHKHAELIKAWADGAEIQWYANALDVWKNTPQPIWEEATQYRIKPPESLYKVGDMVMSTGYYVHEVESVEWNEEEGEHLYELHTLVTGNTRHLSSRHIEGKVTISKPS